MFQYCINKNIVSSDIKFSYITALLSCDNDNQTSICLTDNCDCGYPSISLLNPNIDSKLLGKLVCNNVDENDMKNIYYMLLYIGDSKFNFIYDLLKQTKNINTFFWLFCIDNLQKQQDLCVPDKLYNSFDKHKTDIFMSTLSLDMKNDLLVKSYVKFLSQICKQNILFNLDTFFPNSSLKYNNFLEKEGKLFNGFELPENCIVSGGSIVLVCFSDEQHRKNYTNSDIDIFTYNDNENKLLSKNTAQIILVRLKQVGYDIKMLSTCIAEARDNLGNIIQIICTRHKSPVEIITKFDMHYIECFYDIKQKQCFSTIQCLNDWVHKKIICRGRLYNNLPINRALKAIKKGFSFNPLPCELNECFNDCNCLETNLECLTCITKKGSLETCDCPETSFKCLTCISKKVSLKTCDCPETSLVLGSCFKHIVLTYKTYDYFEPNFEKNEWTYLYKHNMYTDNKYCTYRNSCCTNTVHFPMFFVSESLIFNNPELFLNKPRLTSLVSKFPTNTKIIEIKDVNFDHIKFGPIQKIPTTSTSMSKILLVNEDKTIGSLIIPTPSVISYIGRKSTPLKLTDIVSKENKEFIDFFDHINHMYAILSEQKPNTRSPLHFQTIRKQRIKGIPPTLWIDTNNNVFYTPDGKMVDYSTLVQNERIKCRALIHISAMYINNSYKIKVKCIEIIIEDYLDRPKSLVCGKRFKYIKTNSNFRSYY